MLKDCKKLKDSSTPAFRKVFIAPDMTLAEREVYNGLVKLRDDKSADEIQ